MDIFVDTIQECDGATWHPWGTSIRKTNIITKYRLESQYEYKYRCRLETNSTSYQNKSRGH